MQSSHHHAAICHLAGVSPVAAHKGGKDLLYGLRACDGFQARVASTSLGLIVAGGIRNADDTGDLESYSRNRLAPRALGPSRSFEISEGSFTSPHLIAVDEAHQGVACMAGSAVVVSVAPTPSGPQGIGSQRFVTGV